MIDGLDDAPRKSGLSDARIVKIAQQKGEFEVSWRYRDEPLVRQCKSLVLRGFLRKVSGKPGAHHYKAVSSIQDKT